MPMSCNKLERQDISLRHGELTDVGLEYIEKYGVNLISLSLTLIGNSNAGLVKLSEGCPRLRKLKLRDCPFSKQAVASCVFNIPSLRVHCECGTRGCIRKQGISAFRFKSVSVVGLVIVVIRWQFESLHMHNGSIGGGLASSF
ncbi:leucine-rich repeat, cysteine-containing subtype protein [Tanacetum coccineum]